MNRTKFALISVISILFLLFMAADGYAESQDEHELSMLVGRSHLVESKHRFTNVVVVDDSVADAEIVSPHQVVLYGKRLGSTDVMMQYENGTSARYFIEVLIDDTGLQTRLDSLFGRGIVVDASDGVLVLKGQLETVDAATRLEAFMKASGLDYVDMTSIPGVQQVLLRVRIAEVSRRGIRELGFSAVVGGASAFGGVQTPTGSTSGLTRVGIEPLRGSNGGISPSSYVYQAGAGVNQVTSAATLFGGVPAADLAMYIRALKENNYVRILAEPNLVAISGEEATFLVGGEFPVPIVQGTSVGVGSSISVEYKEVGVRLKFRPEVLGQNRVRLQVAPEVSQISEQYGTSVGGTPVPGVATRRSSTVVELRSGQTFAMAGLLESKTDARNSSIPLLGDLPLIGPLFRSVRYQENQTELVVLVTAELVEPIDSVGTEPLPGFLHKRPNDWQFFVDGRIEGTVVAPLPPSQAAQARKLGLDKLTGPGAWRRFDELPEPARPDLSLPALPRATDRDSGSGSEGSGMEVSS